MNENKIAFLSSILFHLLLIFIAFVIHYQIIPSKLLKKIEVVEFGLPQKTSNERFITPKSEKSEMANNLSKGQKSNLIPKKVDLPHMISQTQKSLYTPQYEETVFNEIDLNEKIGNTTEKINGNLTEKISTEDVENTEKAYVSTNQDYLNNLSDKLLKEEGRRSPYILEGEASNRVIISKVIPEYPKGVQKNLKVKIQFDVLKDGSVSNMLVVQKADPILEMHSLQALRQWKFNELSQDVIQKGKITFIYELE